jgi:hypothetical protein
MNDVDRRLMQDKQDQLLAVAKKAMVQQKEINELHQALTRIASYDTPDEIRQDAADEYGLDYEEALEMAYENIIQEAKSMLGKYPPNKPVEPTGQS